ncbi:MAG: Dam family site-specific DNA-(adenine-N6)-methyltransferase [Pseudomonadota bacterium]
MAIKKAKRKRDNTVRPFLKWAGNKYRILDKIKVRLPQGKRLVEPFAGSGAVFLNTEYERYLLCDSNRDLIDLYTLLKDEGEEFIELAHSLFTEANNRPERYYALREEFNHCNERERRAALFVYLNRHGYNGLCRYNAGGGFNVPFGRYKRPYFPAREMLAFHHKAQRARFRHQGFVTTIRQSRSGDVIYCDPPYVPLSPSANFTGYSAGGFNLVQQEQLASLSEKAAERGIPVLISNHNTAFAREIYHKARLHRFFVQRNISCDGKKRNKAGELLALYSP